MTSNISYVNSIAPECELHTFLKEGLGPTSVIVDLGGNVGGFSYEVNRIWGCICYVVEASVATIAKMPSIPGLYSYNYAICGHNSRIEMFLQNEISGAWQSTNIKGRGRSMLVQGITLETFLQEIGVDSIDLLKCDIEGEEISMFDTTKDETLKKMAQITCEFHDFKWPQQKSDIIRIISRMKGLGFFVFPMSRSNFADVLFVNGDKINLSFFRVIYIRYFLKWTRLARRRLKRITIWALFTNKDAGFFDL